MASVELDSIWLHDAENYADYVQARAGELNIVSAADGEVRTYAGGRRRLIRGPAKPRTMSVSMPNVGRDVVDELESRRGKVQMVRDGRGRVVFGVFLAVQVDETRGLRDRASVSLTLQEVSGTVEV